MDIVYRDTPIKVCIGYTLRGKKVTYRPDQEFLNKVKPVYKEFKTWDKEKVQKAKKYVDLPKEAKVFLTYISKYLGVPILMITTGPKREQGIRF
jgi:adenylosuccinate synthase